MPFDSKVLKFFQIKTRFLLFALLMCTFRPLSFCPLLAPLMITRHITMNFPGLPTTSNDIIQRHSQTMFSIDILYRHSPSASSISIHQLHSPSLNMMIGTDLVLSRRARHLAARLQGLVHEAPFRVPGRVQSLSGDGLLCGRRFPDADQ